MKVVHKKEKINPLERALVAEQISGSREELRNIIARIKITEKGELEKTNALLALIAEQLIKLNESDKN